MTFRKGQSGNPAGRRPGSRSRWTVLAERLMEAETEPVVRAVLAAARGGDMAACRLVLERVAPLRKGRAVPFPLPPITTPEDLPVAMAAVVAAVADGTLSPEEAAAVASVLEAQRRVVETVDLERRIAQLEELHGEEH
jgi:hypothetical protein